MVCQGSSSEAIGLKEFIRSMQVRLGRIGNSAIPGFLIVGGGAGWDTPPFWLCWLLQEDTKWPVLGDQSEREGFCRSDEAVGLNGRTGWAGDGRDGVVVGSLASGGQWWTVVGGCLSLLRW